MHCRDPHSFLVLWTRARSLALVGLDLRALEGQEDPRDPLNGALDRAERALRRRVVSCGGIELALHLGSCFAAAFEDPGSALRFALAARDRLDQISAGFGGEAVRIGAHLATAPRHVAPRLSQVEDEFRLLDRVVGSSLAGGVLVTGPLWRAAQHAQPADVLVNDLGPRRLSGVEGTREIIELRLADASGPASEPPLDLPELTNLSPNPSSFVGRERELRELDRLLGSGARLVTLLGPPGMGKSRLAARYAALNLFRYSGGVIQVDLPGLTTPSSLLLGLAAVLAVPSESLPDLRQTARQVGHALRSRGALLLLLDGVERLAEGASEVLGQWLLASPSARVLVTSRERLRLDGEVVCEVGAMSSDDATALFLRRLGEARPNLELNATEQLAVAELVERLDRLPLAIELAAARASSVSPASVLFQLSRAQGSRSAHSEGGGVRANTLVQALDLTWGALSEVEQDALTQLSVFRGGFDMEAAEAVVELSYHEDQPWLLDVIESLCDRSLIRAEPPGPGDAVRFQIFGMIRDYAGRKLAEGSRKVEVERRHRSWVIRLGEALGEALDAPGGERALRRLVQERDNLEMAAATARRLPRDPEHAVRALLAMAPLYRQSLPLEALQNLLDAMIRESAELPPHWRVRGLLQRSEVNRLLGRAAAALSDLEEATRWMAQVSSAPLEAELLTQLARTHRGAGRLDQAAEVLERALKVAQRGPDTAIQAQILYTLATIQMAWGQLDLAERNLNAARHLHQEAGRVRPMARVLTALARLYAEQLHFDAARSSLQTALRMDTELLSPSERVTATRAMGALLLDLGRFRDAERHLKEALALARHLGARVAEGAALTYLGLLEMERGRLDQADAALLSALEIAEETRLTLQAAVARAHVGILRQQQGRPAEAQALFAEAVSTLDGARFSQTLYTTRGWLAVSLASLGRADDAREALRPSLESKTAATATRDGMTVPLCAALTELLLAPETGPERQRAEAAARGALDLAARADAPSPGVHGQAPPPLSRSSAVRQAARMLQLELSRPLPSASSGLE